MKSVQDTTSDENNGESHAATTDKRGHSSATRSSAKCSITMLVPATTDKRGHSSATLLAALKTLGSAEDWVVEESQLALDPGKSLAILNSIPKGSAVADLGSVAKKGLEIHPNITYVDAIPTKRTTPMTAIEALIGAADSSTAGTLILRGFPEDVIWHKYGWLEIAVQGNVIVGVRADCKRLNAI